MVRTYLKKRNKPDVPQAVIQEAMRAVQERYRMTHMTLHYRI